jgi:hypothetical protein
MNDNDKPNRPAPNGESDASPAASNTVAGKAAPSIAERIIAMAMGIFGRRRMMSMIYCPPEIDQEAQAKFWIWWEGNQIWLMQNLGGMLPGLVDSALIMRHPYETDEMIAVGLFQSYVKIHVNHFFSNRALTQPIRIRIDFLDSGLTFIQGNLPSGQSNIPASLRPQRAIFN